MRPPEINIEEEFSKRLIIHSGLSQEVVVTTVDKLRLCLLENEECIAARKQWVPPLSALFALVAAQMTTTEFKDFWPLEAAGWKAMFLFSTVGCFFWLLISIFQAIRNWKKGGIDHIVDQLKASAAREAFEEEDAYFPNGYEHIDVARDEDR